MVNRHISRRGFLKAVGVGAASLAMPGGRLLGEVCGDRPNIILIMADDMGYSDIGCYGGEIATPNIDRLAANGLRFTQFYNTARCCPTRASLMTGLYPHQTGMGWMTAANLGYEGYKGDLNNRCVTIAELLKRRGYSTYMAGKWHVTYNGYFEGPKHSWPCQRGFDRFYGTLSGGGNYFDPTALTRDNTRIKAPGEGYYYTDAISDNAAKFIKEHEVSKGDEPYFLYVAYTSPHWPLHAKPHDIERYRGKYIKGWDALRVERHRRMIEMGLVEESWEITPRDVKAKSWEEVDAAKGELWDLRMAVYAAQIDCMDQGIGQIVSAVEKSGKLDNTLIMFLSDNGGCAEGISRAKKDIKLLGAEDSFESYRVNWANASNTPFRLYKHWVHEGGIATPLVVHWPGRIKARGEQRHQPGHVIDIMATCIDITGAKYPRKHKGKKIVPLEGKSLVPAFDNWLIEREAIYWEHEGNRAIRVGKWKLVAKGKEGAWELYDLEADRTELNDLAKWYPDRVKKLAEMWQRWAEHSKVLPLDGRGWNERLKTDKGPPLAEGKI
ncbi:MAG: sulfatase-like hydrolase/transferase [Planctomycetota bacterium]|nr:MAG: sulfatase-like hydrolase/transferase [Planctomycetota bacterium]